eukprot:1675227-Pyramimonas_sp.AAC.1
MFAIASCSSTHIIVLTLSRLLLPKIRFHLFLPTPGGGEDNACINADPSLRYRSFTRSKV